MYLIFLSCAMDTIALNCQSTAHMTMKLSMQTSCQLLQPPSMMLCCMLAWFNTPEWAPLKEVKEGLTCTLHSYVVYLQSQNKKMKVHHCSPAEKAGLLPPQMHTICTWHHQQTTMRRTHHFTRNQVTMGRFRNNHRQGM